MLKLAKIVLMAAIAMGVQSLPGQVTSAYAQQPTKTSTFSVVTSKDFCHLKPGETATVDINVQKQKASDQIELAIKTSPLMVRTVEDSANSNAMSHHATLYVTAPANIAYKNYKLVVTTTDSNGKAKKNKLSFLVGDEDNDASVNFHISGAYTTVDWDFHIDGLGFGERPKVIVNGKDVSDKITASTDNTVDLKAATREEFNLIQLEHDVFYNQVIVVVGDKVTNDIRLPSGPRDLEDQD